VIKRNSPFTVVFGASDIVIGRPCCVEERRRAVEFTSKQRLQMPTIGAMIDLVQPTSSPGLANKHLRFLSQAEHEL
jgi:hypothetical protein